MLRSANQKFGSEQPHDEGDGAVDDLPDAGAIKPWLEDHGAEADGEEPDKGCRRGTDSEGALLLGMACIGDAAQENDSIEIDMGVEEGECGACEKCRF